MAKIIPLRGYCLIETMNEEKSEAGLYRPESSKDKPSKGRVLAVGNGTQHFSNGQTIIIPPEINVGDIVYFHRWSASDLPDLKNQVLVKYQDIQGVEK